MTLVGLIWNLVAYMPIGYKIIVVTSTRNGSMGRFVITCLVSIFIFCLGVERSFASGDLYDFAITKSQKDKFYKCLDFDRALFDQLQARLNKGDVKLIGMYPQTAGYLFRLHTNEFGSWVEHRPLKCDMRTAEQKLKDNKEEERLLSVRAENAEKEKKLALQAAEIAKVKAKQEAELQTTARVEKAAQDAQNRHKQDQVNACVSKANAKAVRKLRELGKSWKGGDDYYSIEGGMIIATGKIWFDGRKTLKATVECELYAFGEEGKKANAKSDEPRDVKRYAELQAAIVEKENARKELYKKFKPFAKQCILDDVARQKNGKTSLAPTKVNYIVSQENSKTTVYVTYDAVKKWKGKPLDGGREYKAECTVNTL